MGTHKKSAKNIFQRIEKTVFRQSREEYYAKVTKVLVERCGYNRKNPHTHTHTMYNHPVELR